jgi:glycosyltransferase involved in cell wall biosynthesis
LKDVVVHSTTGFFVPPSDPAALSVAMDDLLALPDQGASLGAAGRERALATFSPAAVAHRYAGLYARAVETSRR